MVFVELLVILVAYLVYNFYWKRKDLPPGPTPLPLVGNALSIGKTDPYSVFLNWKEKFGPIYTYWLGEIPVVCLANFEVIKETFIKDGDTYTGAALFGEFQKEFFGVQENYGIFTVDGEKWRNQRRFTLQTLRNFGMGTNKIEETIMLEVNRVLETVDKAISDEKKDINLIPTIEICIGSIINQILLGYRFIGDTVKEFIELKTIMQRGIQDRGNPLVQIVMFKPYLKHLPIFNKLWDQLMVDGGKLNDFFAAQVESQKHKYKLEGSPEDASNYVEAFLIEMNRQEKLGQSTEFCPLQMQIMLGDLWIAGQETTTNTTNFGILYLSTHPEAQKKMQEELDRVVGTDRKVTLADRPKLPYTNAVINEIQRMCNLLPQNLFHKTTKDVNIQGHHIKQGTTIVAQISCLMCDPEVFPEPEKFRPERFIDEKGQVKKIEELVPFSVGKRVCAGESLARNELYLFLANLFHEFKVTYSDSNTSRSLDKIIGLTVQPVPYTVNAARRIPAIE